MLHPQLAQRSCQDCQRWLYDPHTLSRVERGGQPLTRPAHTPPPCWECPKHSPARAGEFELSAKNVQALAHFLATRNAGLSPREARDPIVRRNRAALEWVFYELARETAPPRPAT